LNIILGLVPEKTVRTPEKTVRTLTIKTKLLPISKFFVKQRSHGQHLSYENICTRLF